MQITLVGHAGTELGRLKYVEQAQLSELIAKIRDHTGVIRINVDGLNYRLIPAHAVAWVDITTAKETVP